MRADPQEERLNMAQLLIAHPHSRDNDDVLDFLHVETINTGEQRSTADLRQAYADRYMAHHAVSSCIIIQLNATVHPEAYETVEISQTRPSRLPAALQTDQTLEVAGAQEAEKG